MASVRAHRAIWPAAAAAAVAFAVLGGPSIVAWLQPKPAGPTFPTSVASYSWLTPHTSVAPIASAVMLYQNGIGVELGDLPQSVLLSADGAAYRRFGAAEALSTPAGQGDPAYSVLSADGTFVVVGGGNGQGAVEVVTIADDSRRTVSIGAQRSIVPVSIAEDGRTVVVLLSPTEISRAADYAFELHTDLGVLDLGTGALREYPDLTDVNAAAITPDGTRILVDRGTGFAIVDVANGAAAEVEASAGLWVDDDAWSPDGSRFAGMDGDVMQIVDPATGETTEHHIDLPGADIDWGYAVGWRDAETVLVYATEGVNSGEFAWVDADTGAQTSFATYEPGWTGAAIGGPDTARDLVATWTVAERPVDRAALPLIMPALGALAIGWAVWLFTPRRKTTEPGSAVDLPAVDDPAFEPVGAAPLRG